MQNSKGIFESIVSQLRFDDLNERKAVAFWLMEYYLNLSRTDILTNKEILQNAIDWKPIIERLNVGEPIQYVLGETTFFGRRFIVTSDVLIPRPETEELVQLTLFDLKNRTNSRVIDIGTGSGCLAISLAAEQPEAEVIAMDISTKALKIAEQNAQLNGVEVEFIQEDILQPLTSLSADIIISNPPYVRKQEAADMQRNVLEYEPHLALFVSDDNPLLFYEAIGGYARQNLSENGCLYLEINEYLGEETKSCIERCDFGNVQIVNDINGKERFIVASQPRLKK